MREVALQPGAALGEGLVLGVNVIDFLQRRGGDQGVVDLEVNLRDGLELALYKTVERLAHGTLGRVLNRDDAVVSLALLHGGEDIPDGRDGLVVHTRAKFLDRGGVRIGRLGAEVGDLEGFLQGDGGRHDLAVDRVQRLGLYRPLAQGGDLAKHGVLALRHVDLATGVALQAADLGG